ncbi:MAG: methionine--tRNA ligase subunit beta, partial [Muribaculaceae bacterium]|nr:methionine--tRNA ligase subunit beta [Muribaculaceae bacterium]
DFPGKQDTLRYVLTANAPETKDNDFTWRDFQARNNSELVAILGNFVNRAMVLTHKYFEGKVPVADGIAETDSNALAEVAAAGRALTTALEGFHFREALKEAMNMARTGNRYLQETEPWKIAKSGDMERVGVILNTALQICASIAVAFEPFLPFMSGKLCKMLGMGDLCWDMVGKTDNVAAGTQLGEPELLFEKIEDEAIQAQIDKLNAAKEANKINSWKAAPQAPDVDFDTFMKADLRVGTVLECERVPKADKLLRFLIDDGLEKRTIVSGIAAHYAPETLVGKQVVFIANLPPRKLRGIVSQGMILSAENADGSLTLLTPMAQATPGAQVK